MLDIISDFRHATMVAFALAFTMPITSQNTGAIHTIAPRV